VADFADPSWHGAGPADQADSAPPSGMPDSEQLPENGAAAPAGEVYDWYVRGRDLLGRGDAAAAVQVLAHTVAAEPSSRSAREMLARAQFDSRQYAAAAANFAVLVERDPSDHYAQFGLGLSSHRVGDLAGAVEHLALASAMRPDLHHYARALRSARTAATPR
jgi:predicted Zn-dependent protease